MSDCGIEQACAEYRQDSMKVMKFVLNKLDNCEKNHDILVASATLDAFIRANGGWK